MNTGALFGIGQGQVAFFAGASFLAIAGVLWWITRGAGSQSLWLSVTLGLVLGGILGNLYDRLGLWGFRGVRDWILIQYGEYVWPNFNIADSLLVCGAAMLVWHAYRQESAPKPQAPAVSHHAR